MVRSYIPFGEFLNNIIAKKKISIQDLSAKLNMKSRNNIYRLIKGEGSFNKILEFKKEIMKYNILELSLNEIKEMEQAIEVSRWGAEKVQSRKLMMHMIKGTLEKQQDAQIIPLDGCDRFCDLSSLIADYANYDKVDILLVNAAYPNLMDMLCELLEISNKVESKIEHIIQVSTNKTDNVRILSSILKLININNYHPYYDTNCEIPLKQGIPLLSDFMIAKKVKGQSTEIDLVKVGYGCINSTVYSTKDSSLFSFYKKVFLNIKEFCIPLVQSFYQKEYTSNVIEISDRVAALEYNNSTIQYKYDLSYSIISDEIILGLIIDGVKSLEYLFKAHKRRYDNIWDKKKMVIHIYSKEGMLEFIRTKKLSDHLPILRPFTADEIKILIGTLIYQAENYPYFQIYILKEKIAHPNFAIHYTKGKYVLIDNSLRSYRNYKPAIISARSFIEITEDFIYNELLHNYTLSKEDSIQFLQGLIKLVD